MKKICLNCTHFECCDDDGEFLACGYCVIDPHQKDVKDEDTCDVWAANKQREKDLEDGM